MNQVNQADVEDIVKKAGVKGFTGKFKALGEGETNDTFALDLEGGKKVILRVAKYSGEKLLHQEAKALSLLDLEQVPRLYFLMNATLSWADRGYRKPTCRVRLRAG